MSKTPDNNNANAGRQTGKSAGRPVRVSSVKQEEKPAAEKPSAGKKRGRPKGAEKAKQKQKPAPDKQPLPDLQDFKIPADFHSMEDPRVAEQLERIAESLIQTNDDYIPFVDEASRGDINNPSLSPIANWYSGVSRYLPLKFSYLAACANLGWIRSQQAKVECTYDASGRLKSRKITQSTGNPAYLTLAQSLLEAEIKWAEKMKPAQTDKLVLDVPAGGDVRKHKIVELIRRRLEVLEKQKASVVVESPSTAG
jgi:outer membrane biosynthesis protein TonB